MDDELENERIKNPEETQEDHERVIHLNGTRPTLVILDECGVYPSWVYDAMLAFQTQMEEDRDPNSPRNQHQREMEKRWVEGGYKMPPLPQSVRTIDEDVEKQLLFKLKPHLDQLNTRDRKNTGARKQQRAAKARRRKK